MQNRMLLGQLKWLFTFKSVLVLSIMNSFCTVMSSTQIWSSHLTGHCIIKKTSQSKNVGKGYLYAVGCFFDLGFV